MGRDRRDANYDEECYLLAGHFLRDYRLTDAEREDERHRLATAIQQLIEDELEPLAHRERRG